MQPCTDCPRNCLVDRQYNVGFCHAPWQPEVATICVHKGEEPPICGVRGICNVFFAHCNMQCCYCQNNAISRREVSRDVVFFHTLNDIVDRIASVLSASENVVGFVSPSHYAHCLVPIVEALHERGLFPTVVYNTNGYDSVDVLKRLAPYVDVYLPDLKYADNALAKRYSATDDYVERAHAALCEMYRQMGPTLHTDETGLAFRGLMVRHLVLPGCVDNTLRCLDWLAEHLSNALHVSLMAQYFPPDTGRALPDDLGRGLTRSEYEAVTKHFFDLGFTNGWLQELEAGENYKPNFNQIDAFC